MKFDPQAYGPGIAAILQLDGDGQRLMPLAISGGANERARAMILECGAAELVKAGLYLYFDCWSQAHEIAQDIGSAEGSYWHAIVHRQEPDAWNSGYWFRRVGAHAIFPALREEAAGLGLSMGPRWKPEAFIEMCEKARTCPGSELERQAREVQRAEWQLLFDYCART
jgi:hypothetical protein